MVAGSTPKGAEGTAGHKPIAPAGCTLSAAGSGHGPLSADAFSRPPCRFCPGIRLPRFPLGTLAAGSLSEAALRTPIPGWPRAPRPTLPVAQSSDRPGIAL